MKLSNKTIEQLTAYFNANGYDISFGEIGEFSTCTLSPRKKKKLVELSWGVSKMFEISTCASIFSTDEINDLVDELQKAGNIAIIANEIIKKGGDSHENE